MEDPDGDASKNEERPRSNVNETQIEVIGLDSSEREGVEPFLNLLGESPVNENPPVPKKEGQSSRGDFSMFEHNADLDSNSSLFGAIVQQILNGVLNKFNPEELLNQKQVVPNSIHAEGVLRDQKEPLLEVEHSEPNFGKTISDSKMKDVKPDSSRGLGLGTGNFEESDNAENPPVPIYEDAKEKIISDFNMKDAKPDSSIDLRLFGHVIGNFVESEHAKNPPVPVFEDAEEKIISDFNMKDAKPDSSIDLRLFGHVIGNFIESEHAENPPLPMYEHAEGKTINDFKMKDAEPDSSIDLRLFGHVIGNFAESKHAKNPPVLVYEDAEEKIISYFNMKDAKPDSSIDLRLFGHIIGNFIESEHAKNPPLPMYEHAEGKTINDFKMKDAEPDSSSGQTFGLVMWNYEKSDNAENPPIPTYEHGEGKITSDLNMKDAKPDSSIDLRLFGDVIRNLEESEHAKNPPIPMYEHAEGDALNQNKLPIEAEDNDQDPRMTISDIQIKDVKSDPSRRKRVRFVLDNIKESENGKDRPVPNKEGHCSSEDVSMHEHADGDALDRNKLLIEAEDNYQDLRMAISDIQIKDVKSDPSRRKRVRFVLDNIKESEHGKDRPVPNKEGHCSSEDVFMHEHADGDALDRNKLLIEAEDNDQDLRMTISDVQNKIVKSDSSRRPRVRFVMKNIAEHGKDGPVPNKEGHCSSGDVPVHEHAAESNLDLAKLGKHTLRRYKKQFEIKGFNHRSSKEKLLKAVQRHFYAHPPLDMQQVIPEFVAAAMKNKA